MIENQKQGKLERFFMYVFVPLVMLWVAWQFVGTLYTGFRTGNVPAAFGVSTPQFLFVCSGFGLMLLTSRFFNNRPPNSLFSTSPDSPAEAGKMGGAIGIAVGASFWLFEGVDSFYLRWGLRLLLLEVAVLGIVVFMNIKHRKAQHTSDEGNTKA